MVGNNNYFDNKIYQKIINQYQIIDIVAHHQL